MHLTIDYEDYYYYNYNKFNYRDILCSLPIELFLNNIFVVHFTSHSFGNKMLTSERVPEWLICNVQNPSQGWEEADAQHFCQYPLTVVHD